MWSPRISVITPVYNGEPFADRCYWALNQQTVKDWEWIVVDDGSTDNTSAVLRKLSLRDSRIQLFRSTTNRGMGVARTLALSEARARWVVVNDVDDLSFPWRLERMIEAMNRGYDFACSLVVVADPAMRILGVRDFENPLYSDRIVTFTHPSLACSTELARRIGYSPELSTVHQIGEDKRIIMTLAARYKGYYHRAPLLIHQPSVGSLRRAIHSNMTDVYRVHQLYHDGTLELSVLQYIRAQLRRFMKLGALNMLRVRPRLYDQIMQLRRLGRPAGDYELAADELGFIAHYVSRSWEMCGLSEPNAPPVSTNHRRYAPSVDLQHS
jgi:glycosyltransferase involved in cell wall biosynthesis